VTTEDGLSRRALLRGVGAFAVGAAAVPFATAWDSPALAAVTQAEDEGGAGASYAFDGGMSAAVLSSYG
jgi:hypothetical protein